MSNDTLGMAALLLVAASISVVLILVIVGIRFRRSAVERSHARLRKSLLEAWTRRSPALIRSSMDEVASGSLRSLADLAHCARAAQERGLWDEELVGVIRESVHSSGLGTRLLAMLDSRRPQRRGLAVLLGGLSICTIDEHTLARFLYDPDPTVRLTAVASLAQEQTPEAAVELITALNENLVEEPRIIERLGEPWAVSTVIEALSDDRHEPETRNGLLSALAISRDARALPIATRLAKSADDEKLVRSLRVLAACADVANTDQLTEIATIARTAAYSRNAAARNIAATLLTYLSSPEREEILTLLARDPDWFVRRSAVRTLLSVGDEGIRRVHELTQDADTFTAQRAREEWLRRTIRITSPAAADG